MSPVTAFFIYFLIWWVMLFTVLPLGVERHGGDDRGHDAGAPKIPDLKRKLLLNTLISAAILGVIYILVEMGMIDFAKMFQGGLS